MCCSFVIGDRCARAFLLLAALPALTGYGPVVGEVVSVTDDQTSPRFVSGQQTNVFVAVGDAARMVCAVNRLHDKSVIWVRSQDLQIMSFGETVFTADPRISVHVENSTYVLDIRKTQTKDSGRYECQINTDPKMSLFFNLTVIDQPMPKLKVWISGPPVQSAPAGHTMTFTCEARYIWKSSPPPANFPLPPINVHWLHGNQPITLQTDRGGILVDTDRTASSASSRLTVGDVTLRDEGQYTCVAGQQRDQLVFHLQRGDDEYGEHVMEAMQRDQSHGSSADAASVTAPYTAIICLALALSYLRTFYI